MSGDNSAIEKQEKHDRKLTEQEDDLIEASEPPFTTHDVSPADGGKLCKVASAKPSVNDISLVPNGGLTAWLQVLSSFMLFMNTWGVVNTFGTYQTTYETGLLSNVSPSNISWIGSCQGTLLMLVGSLTGPIYDAGYCRLLVFTGSVLVVLGQMMLSLSTTYWQVFLSQAVCIGLGAGCMFVPAVAILSTYFSTRIATALGLAAAGSSIGGVIFPIVFHRLEPTIGFPWATRVLGFIMLATLVVSNSVIKVRVLPAGRRKFFDVSAFCELPWVFFVLGSFLGFLGLYTPFFYIQSYAIQTGLADPDLAFYLLAILNGSSTFGRIIPNYIA
jgi:MFS family permease